MHKAIKPYHLLLLLVAIPIITYVVRFRRGGSQVKKKDTYFAIQDIHSITKVVLKEKNRELTIENKNRRWYFNDGTQADNRQVLSMLSLASEMQLYMPLSVTRSRQLQAIVDTAGVQLSFYQNRKKIQSYILWSDTESRRSYAIIKGSRQVCQVYVPDFSPLLQPFFSADIRNWRRQSIIPFSAAHIRSIAVIYPNDSIRSFVISRQDSGAIKVLNYKFEEMPDADVFKAESYLHMLENIQYDKEITMPEEAQKRNLLATIRVLTIKNEEYRIEAYAKADSTANTSDINYLYLIINNSQALLSRYLITDLIIRNLTYFLKNVD